MLPLTKVDNQTTLISNLRIQNLTSCPLNQETFLLNNGTYLASETEKRKTFYPNDKWRMSTTDEQKILLTPNRLLPQESITLIDFDTNIQNIFWTDILSEIVNPNSYPERRIKILQLFADKVLNDLENKYSLKTLSRRSADVAIHPPNSLSTAFNFDENTQIGLHIDNHDQLPLKERSNAFQLLSINLGQSERYLNFINLSVAKILETLGLNINPETEKKFRSIKILKNLFLTNFPSYPIVRLKIKPNQGYLAVTQNFIHDGSTNNQGNPDITFFIGGFFDINQSLKEA